MRIFLQSDFDRFELSRDGSTDFVLGLKTSGLGIGKKVPKFVRGAGAGASYRGTRSDTRVAGLNVVFTADDRAAMEVLFRRLSGAVLPQVGRALPSLVAEYPNGLAFELPFVYLSGLEGGPDAGEVVADFLISVECHNPFWTARDALQFSFEYDATGTPFLDDLSQLPVTSSNVIGQKSVTLAGDVPSDVNFFITGPSSGATTILINGTGFVFETALGAGETISVLKDDLGVTVEDQTFTSRYTGMGPAPKFLPLQPGVNTVSVSMVGATADSRISGNYKPRFEGIY